jgi:hypothetical protein
LLPASNTVQSVVILKRQQEEIFDLLFSSSNDLCLKQFRI